FKLPPLRLFQTVECAGDFCDLTEAQPAVLSFRLHPDEQISLSLAARRPGLPLVLEPVEWELDHGRASPAGPAADRRLLLDGLRGDSTHFVQADELDAAWEFTAPILEAWCYGPPPEFPNYVAGSWGPAEAHRLAEGCRGGWRRP